MFPLEPSPKLNKERVNRQMLDRVDGCRTPGCWIIRDPKETNKVVWLKEKELHHTGKDNKGNMRKGRLVQIKRLLYYMEYEALPTKHIKNYCGEKYCVNPAHCYVPGVQRNTDKVHAQIDVGVLSVANAREWGLFNYE